MNTRSSLHTVFALAVLAAVLENTSDTIAADADKQQYYELRVYSTKSEKQQKLISDYWQNAAVPAYNRMGIQPIGVFTELEDSPTNKIYVLVPYDSLDLFASVPAKLAADSVYQTAGAEYLAATKADPAFERIESSLHVAFEGMKKLALPPSSAEKKPWIFELRTYLSPSESKGDNKVKMFNSGEITLMQEVGMCPVFFAQTLFWSENAQPGLHGVRRKPGGTQEALAGVYQLAGLEKAEQRPPVQGQHDRQGGHQRLPEANSGLADLKNRANSLSPSRSIAALTAEGSRAGRAAVGLKARASILTLPLLRMAIAFFPPPKNRPRVSCRPDGGVPFTTSSTGFLSAKGDCGVSVTVCLAKL